MARLLKRFFCLLTVASALSACVVNEEAEVASDTMGTLANDNSRYAQETSASSSSLSLDGARSAALEPVGNCRLSVLDEKLLIKLNEVRAEARFCGDTLYPAVEPLVWNCNLEGAAQSHSEDMANNNFFSHIGSDGQRVGARADAANYDWIMVGENIAVGYSSVDSVMQGWLNSPSHCRTVMNERYQETAAAVSLPQDADYASYWTLLMGITASE